MNPDSKSAFLVATAFNDFTTNSLTRVVEGVWIVVSTKRVVREGNSRLKDRGINVNGVGFWVLI